MISRVVSLGQVIEELSVSFTILGEYFLHLILVGEVMIHLGEITWVGTLNTFYFLPKTCVSSKASIFVIKNHLIFTIFFLSSISDLTFHPGLINLELPNMKMQFFKFFGFNWTIFWSGWLPTVAEGFILL